MSKKLTAKELEATKDVYSRYLEHEQKMHEFNKLHQRASQLYFAAETELNSLREKLEKKYGSVNIDLSTGEIQQPETQE